MKSIFKLFVIVAILASFAGVSAAQQIFWVGNSSVTVYQDAGQQKLAHLGQSWTDTAQKTYLPQLVVGGGTGYANGFRLLNGYETSVRFDNACERQVNAGITFFGSDGQGLVLKTQPFLGANLLVLLANLLIDSVVEGVLRDPE